MYENNDTNLDNGTERGSDGYVDPASVNHGSTGTNSANNSNAHFGGSQYSGSGFSESARPGSGETAPGEEQPHFSGSYRNADLGGGPDLSNLSGERGGGAGERYSFNDYGCGFDSGVYENPSGDYGDIRSGRHRHSGGGSGGAAVTMTKKRIFSLILACIILSAVVSAATLWAYNNFYHSGSITGKTKGYTLESATGSIQSVSEIAAANTSSIVEIRTESVSTDSWAQQYVTEGAGSGIIIRSNGYIMTNYHVIEGASKITVYNDSDETYPAKVVGYDSANDIAILKISADGLKAVTYGNSDEISVGDMAVVIGNPLGELGDSVSAGIISSKSRSIRLGRKSMNLIQTDASVNPGNSGGGMFNNHGQLIGVIVAKSSGTDVEGLGFAIPVNTAAKIAAGIIDKK